MDRIVSGGFDAYLPSVRRSSRRGPNGASARTLAAVNGEAPAIRRST
jgi:hypothetical protein